MTMPTNLRYALAYAKQGRPVYVFPLHNPIFDDEGNCTGCTCEEYRRSDKYRQRLVEQGRADQFDPNFKCPQPGKCPRVSWSEASTIDEATIRKWWGKPWRNVDVETGRVVWNYPGIAIDAGKSSLLIADEDTYKTSYAGDSLHLDECTVKSLTGGDGSHLWYRQPEGKAYGNATGDLPDGIDIRGVGGYIVAPPTLHKSGKHYRFQDGHSPKDISIAPLPAGLAAILEAAQASRGAADVHFSAHVGHAPDLAQWSLSGEVLELIRNGHPAGADRSSYDQKVITALIYAGATDDEIRDVFAHYAIGAKYLERGDRYLQHSIGKARVYVEDHPPDAPPDQSIMPALHALRAQAQSAEFIEQLREHDIARPADYAKTMIAVVNWAISRGAPRVRLGSRQLGELANCSHMTAKRHLAMFGEGITINHSDGTVTHRPGLNLVTLTDDPDGYGKWIDLSNLLRSVTSTTISPSVRECNTSQQVVDDHLQDEAFVQYPRHLAVKMRPDAEILPYGLSAAALFIAATLSQHGELTRATLCQLTGLSKYTVGKMLRRMADMDLVVVWEGKPYRYDIHPNFEEVLDELRPLLPSFEITKRRGHVNAAARITYINRQLNAPEPPAPRAEAKLKSRRRKYEQQKDELAEAAASNGVDITIKLGEYRAPKAKVAHCEHLDRLRTLVLAGERAHNRPKRNGYKPKRPNVSIFAADAEWDALNAWAQMEYGRSWWLHRDVNGILMAYEQYLAAEEFVPTIHWDEPMGVAA